MRLELLGANRAGPLLLAAAQFRFGGGQIAQTILPFGFQPASDQPIFGLHGPITALGPLRLVACALHFQTPLRQSRVMVGLELFDREQCGFDRGRRDGLEKSVGHGLLDRQSADVETVHAASIDEIFAGAVVTGSRVPAAIVRHANAGRSGRKWRCPATTPIPLSPHLPTDAACGRVLESSRAWLA